MHCVSLHALRRAAIFNSKVCQLCKARNTSCDTSEWESPEGTAAFYSRLAHQLSTFRSLPPPHPLALGRDLRVGWAMLFITVAPGPSTVLGGTQHRGAGWGLRVPRGCSTSGHLVLSQQLDYRHMKARTLRGAFREFFCNGCAQTKKDPGLLLLTGESG